jgi:hypothetical protein
MEAIMHVCLLLTWLLVFHCMAIGGKVSAKMESPAIKGVFPSHVSYSPSHVCEYNFNINFVLSTFVLLFDRFLLFLFRHEVRCLQSSLNHGNQIANLALNPRPSNLCALSPRPLLPWIYPERH